MIRSMTAFAGSEAEISDLTIDCEMRSVNHRYSDITVKPWYGHPEGAVKGYPTNRGGYRTPTPPISSPTGA